VPDVQSVVERSETGESDGEVVVAGRRLRELEMAGAVGDGSGEDGTVGAFELYGCVGDDGAGGVDEPAGKRSAGYGGSPSGGGRRSLSNGRGGEGDESYREGAERQAGGEFDVGLAQQPGRPRGGFRCHWGANSLF